MISYHESDNLGFGKLNKFFRVATVTKRLRAAFADTCHFKLITQCLKKKDSRRFINTFS